VPFCPNCGRDLSPAAQACPNCGHPGPAAAVHLAPPVARPSVVPARRNEGTATASLVCAISGFFMIPVVGSILGIVFGNTAKRRIAGDPTLNGGSLARAGIVVGWVGIGFAVMLIAALIVLASVGNNF
jgi:hypothetical protein